MSDSLTQLAEIIMQGLPGPEGGVRDVLESLFGDRFHKRYRDHAIIRDAYALASGEQKDGVPYAGLIHSDNPPSGPYGGASLVWFPTEEHGSLIGLGVGTRGISPDEGLLTRPGHRRRIAALRRNISQLGVEAWSKPDPSAINISVPKVVRARYPGFERVFKRYGNEMYCNALVSDNKGLAQKVVQAFLYLYAYERNWQIRKEFQNEYDQFIGGLRDDLFPSVSEEQVNDLLRNRRFVVLQGPPGTGKTRLAEKIRSDFFEGSGSTIQFHPAVTYEDFIIGLSPDPEKGKLRFDVKKGWLLESAELAKDKPFVLIIDEINRADLGKILGEAIYLFEVGEVGGDNARTVKLPHVVDGKKTFSFPENLYVLCTMNTADRSIAGMDIAVRRRFSFVNMPPDRSVVAEQGIDLATDIFDRLMDVFIEHAPRDALDLLPGHAYFLAKDEEELKERFRHELLPLLDEYLREGYLGPATTELYAVRDAIEDAIRL